MRPQCLLVIILIALSCNRKEDMLSALLNPKEMNKQLDPISIPYTNDYYLLENLTTRLLALDERGNYQMELAESIHTISPVEYEVKIKESYFSSGEVITAEDVKNTFMRTITKGSSHTSLSKSVSNINVIDNKTIKIILKKPMRSFFYYLSLSDFGILHSSQYSKDLLLAEDFSKVSSGPYIYNKQDTDYYLIKNKYYSLSKDQYPEKIKLINYFNKSPIEIIKEGKADLGKFSIDSFFSLDDNFLEKNDLRFIGTPSASFTYLYFNKNSSLFKNEKHRLWLRKIINDNFSIPKNLDWFARRSKQYFPPESKAYLSDDELDPLLDVLKEIQKPSDFPEEIVIHTYTTAFKVTHEPIVKMLEKIPGIKITIKNTINPNEYSADFSEGKFDIFLNIMSTDFRVPVEAINYEFFSNEGALTDKNNFVKNEFEEYQQSESESQEINHLKRISKFIVNSNEIIPLFHSAIPYVYNHNRLQLNGLNHLFIFNFWKIRLVE